MHILNILKHLMHYCNAFFRRLESLLHNYSMFVVKSSLSIHLLAYTERRETPSGQLEEQYNIFFLVPPSLLNLLQVLRQENTYADL